MKKAAATTTASFLICTFMKAKICAGNRILFFSSSVNLIIDLQAQNQQHQPERSGVGDDDGRRPQINSVYQPQGYARSKSQKHAPGNFFRRLALPGLDQLRQEGNGGQGSGHVADGGDK